MDNKNQARGIKRPRSASKGAKLATSSTEGNDPAALPSTAKPEVAPIIKALKCMSSDEEARFEAFRRCSLPINAVTKLVVAFLSQAILRRSCMESTGLDNKAVRAKDRVKILPKIVRDALADPDKVKDWNQVLQSLVLPKTSREISIIVSSLTKMYAQRVVTAACVAANRDTTSDSEEKGKLLPKHLFETHLNSSFPMFYLDSKSSIFAVNTTSMVNSFKSKAEIAMEAQAVFDEESENEENSSEKGLDIDINMIDEQVEDDDDNDEKQNENDTV